MSSSPSMRRVPKTLNMTLMALLDAGPTLNVSTVYASWFGGGFCGLVSVVRRLLETTCDELNTTSGYPSPLISLRSHSVYASSTVSRFTAPLQSTMPVTSSQDWSWLIHCQHFPPC